MGDSHAAEEKEQLQAQFASKGNPQGISKLGQRSVWDPVTGRQVLITDAGNKHQTADDDSDASSDSSDAPAQSAEPTDTTHNLLLHPFPTSPPQHIFDALLTKLDRVSFNSAALVLLANGVHWLCPIPKSLSAAISLFSLGGVYLYTHSAKLDLERSVDRLRHELHLARATHYSPPSPESAEWLNGLINGIWPLIDTKLFEGVVDMVEDIMHSSLPKMIQSVKISDLSQGDNPFRLIYMRRLPPKEKNGQKTREQQEAALEADDEDGTFVNYELEVGYHARPGMNIKNHNIRLLLELFMSMKDLFNIPISVWAQLESFHATLRLRVQLTDAPPFLGSMLFSFMGLPKVSISVNALNKHLPNVVDLPVLHDFVQDSIAAACSAYVAPKSMSLDLGEILMGSGVKMDTDGVGVLRIDIERAVDLEGKDADGKSDPFVIASFASLGKPIYTTRVLDDDCNPVWKETGFVIVDPADLKAHEELLLMLWDQDRGSDPDLLGRIRVPLQNLVDKPQQEREDELFNLKGDKKFGGKLFWRSTFYPKVDLINPKPSEPEDKTMSQQVTAKDCPMNKKRLSGILSITVHEAHHVEKRTSPDADLDKEDLPSPYVVAYVDDERLFKTRTKQYTNRAPFNKTQETFVRNWREAVVRLELRDAVPREKDPVLGEIELALADFFKNGSQATELRSIRDGTGYGRLSISMVFRSVDAELPKHLIGRNRGYLNISALSFEPTASSEQLPSDKVRLSTKFDSYKLAHRASIQEGGNTKWDVPTPIQLAFKNRRFSRLSFEFGRGFQIAGIGKDAEALAALRLGHVPDNEPLNLKLPVVVGDDLEDFQEHVLDDNQTQNCNKLRVIGHLRLEGSITPDLNAKPVKGGDDDSDEASSVAKTRSERVRPQSPASPSGSFRKSFKNRTRRFKDMFKSDSEGE